MLSIFGRYPACCNLMRVRGTTKNGFVAFRDAAIEDEIKLMLVVVGAALGTKNFGNMQELFHRDSGSDFFPAFAAKRVFKRFTSLLFSAGKCEIAAFDGMLFLLHEQLFTTANKCAGSGPDRWPKLRLR